MADAAQEFLDKQLSKNRFTAKQQQRLDNSGGAAVTNASEGVIPGGDAYAKYGKMPGSEPASTSTPASSKSGKLGGSRSAANIRKEFGLNYDANNIPDFASANTKDGKLQSDDGHIWYKDNAGQTQYLGQVAGGYERGSIGDGKDSSEGRQGSDKSMFHADYGKDGKKKEMSGKHHQSSNSLLQQAHDERNGPGHDNGFNSINDVANAMRHMMNNDNVSTEPEKERTPIEHSPEVKQAKERVRAYEDDIMSGKTSEDMFGDFDASSSTIGSNNWGDNMSRINDKYQLDLNAGAAGIGTANSSSQAEAPAKAADSFLSAQKSTIKKDYNFKPSYSYGQN